MYMYIGDVLRPFLKECTSESRVKTSDMKRGSLRLFWPKHPLEPLSPGGEESRTKERKILYSHTA